MNYHPKSPTNRHKFIGLNTGTYFVKIRLTQTKTVGTMVPIEELVSFAEEIKWIASKIGLPVDKHTTNSNNILLQFGEVERTGNIDLRFEAKLEKLAQELNIGLSKGVGMYKGVPSTSDSPSVFTEYHYGWGEKDATNVYNENMPYGNVDFIGGYRGSPESEYNTPEMTLTVKS